MLGLSATYNYFLSYGSVDMRKGCFSLSQLVRDEMNENPLDGNNIYIFLAKNLNQELAKERDRNSNNNRKTYCRTSEQARLLNNRNVDERSKEKANFEGGSVETSTDATSTDSPSKETKKEKRVRGKKVKSEDKFVNETVMHKLADYHTLPDGGHYLTRKGEIETYLYEYTEYHPARVVRHIYEVARVAMPDGETYCIVIA